MQKRSTEFYRDNEARIMDSLGLYHSRDSGSGWKRKGDGRNEAIIAELKTTDKRSMTIHKGDLDKIEQQAMVCGKMPLFVANWLMEYHDPLAPDDVWLMMKPAHLMAIAKYLRTGELETAALEQQIQANTAANANRKRKRIGSSTKKVSESERYKKGEVSAF